VRSAGTPYLGGVATILLYGDTIRYPALRHEVPLEIMDPFLFVARDGRELVLMNSLEADRISRALPGAELLQVDELGYYELIKEGMPRDEAQLDGGPRRGAVGHPGGGRPR
jgi:hypothetical protein